MSQDVEAKSYFDRVVEQWQAKSSGETADYPVVEKRHAAVHAVISSLSKPRDFLDLGCGTGQLCIEAADRGLHATGVDFAPAMIEQCIANRGERDNPVFLTGSAVSFTRLDGCFDVISAQGFIEYIQPEEMQQLFANVRKMLKAGGAFAVGSRNRLFNATTFNEFTEIERKLGTLDSLVGEAIAIQGSRSFSEMLERTGDYEKPRPHPEAHPHVEIEVSLRFQYSPAELIGYARAAGLRAHGIYPLHFHALPIAMKDPEPVLHAALASEIEAMPSFNHRATPWCSSFVMDLRSID